MANKKITELNAASSLAATDVVPVVDVSADETKKITATDLFRTLPDGTAAAPALAFSSDQANGVYLAGTDTVGISTGGTQRVTVDGSGNVTISGDLTVSGATTTVESTTVTIDDKNIELGSVASPSNTTADGGGITLKGATDKTLKWINSTGSWTFNQPMNFNDHVRIDGSGNVLVGTTDSTIYNNGDSDSEGIVLRDGEVVDIARKGDLQLTLNRQTNDGHHIGFFRSGSPKSYIATRSDGFCIDVNSSERFRIDSAGRVGIGNTTMSSFTGNASDNLVVGSGSGGEGITVYSATNNQGSLTFADGTSGDAAYRGAIEYSHTNDKLVFRTAGVTNRVTIDSSGRVGIGSTAPGHTLEVKGSFPDFAIVDSDTTNDKFRILHNGGATQLQVDPNNVSSGSHLLVAVDGSEAARIDSSGRLLVGTTAARTDFFSGSLDADIQVEGSSYAAYSCYATNGNGAFIFGRDNGASGSTIGNLSWQADDGTDEVEAARISGQIDGTPGSNDMPGRLVFSTTADGGSSPTERMRIGNDGKVYFGDFSSVAAAGYIDKATSGSYELDIVASRSTSTNRDIRFFSRSNSESMRLTSDGDLYLGTTTGQYDFELRRSGGATVLIGSTNAQGALLVLDGDSNGDGAGTDYASIGHSSNANLEYKNRKTASHTFHVGTNDTELMRLDSSGRLLLGTTTEGYSDADNFTLADSGHCGITIRSGATNAGAIYFSDGTSGNAEYRGYIEYSQNSDFLRFGSAAVERFRITSTGAWAIEGASNYGTSGQVLTSNGNDSPTWQDASGGGASAINDLSDAVTNSSGATIGLGTGALANDDGSTNNNTAVGKSALNANTSGDNNAALGFEALKSNTTGADNTAVGRRALESNTTGSNNTAVGKNALDDNNGSNNTGVGHHALYVNSSGTENTAIGSTALTANTTGAYNVAVGMRALRDNTTANYNVAVGREALLNNTTGTQNTAVGSLALDANTTANNNTAVGYQALTSSTAANNTAVGAEA